MKEDERRIIFPRNTNNGKSKASSSGDTFHRADIQALSSNNPAKKEEKNRKRKGTRSVSSFGTASVCQRIKGKAWNPFRERLAIHRFLAFWGSASRKSFFFSKTSLRKCSRYIRQGEGLLNPLRRKRPMPPRRVHPRHGACYPSRPNRKSKRREKQKARGFLPLVRLLPPDGGAAAVYGSRGTKQKRRYPTKSS